MHSMSGAPSVQEAGSRACEQHRQLGQQELMEQAHQSAAGHPRQGQKKSCL
ncbi:hypothetical protein JOD53_001259 [Brevibacterium luteolum]|uniref:hypothetical protein n=1 Tax=Brevibacterium luteolum TaxID=199591 RepID=UPI00195720E2|nr:hypothetical protein [Brevibacterium luteolum]MBM7529253.1 hypothetical protein [Brevibacterium luteolum]